MAILDVVGRHYGLPLELIALGTFYRLRGIATRKRKAK